MVIGALVTASSLIFALFLLYRALGGDYRGVAHRASQSVQGQRLAIRVVYQPQESHRRFHGLV